MAKAALDHFVAKITAITPLMDDPLGRNSPAVFQGAATSSNQLVMELTKHAIAFAHQYREKPRDVTALAQSAQRVEGSLMALQAISVISEDQAEALVAELHELLNPA